MFQKTLFPSGVHPPRVGEPMLGAVQINEHDKAAETVYGCADLCNRLLPFSRFDSAIVDHANQIGEPMGGECGHGKLLQRVSGLY